jgi:hypothetical protein
MAGINEFYILPILFILSSFVGFLSSAPAQSLGGSRCSVWPGH